MQVTETGTDGLMREFRVVIARDDLDSKLATRLESLKDKVKIKGFRPGKVPVSHLRKAYGKALMNEIVQEAVSEGSQSAIQERALRPAQQPRIEFEGEIEKVLDGKADLAFKMHFEVMPDFTPADPAKLHLTRYVADVEDADVEKALTMLSEQQRSYTPRKGGEKAEEGDALTIDFEGKIAGQAFEGGTGSGVQVVIGQKRFLPGFEEQLIGATMEEEREVKVTFPADYPATDLAGKEAVFQVKVKMAAAPEEVKIDDSFAVKLGLENLEKLNERIRDQIGMDHRRAARAHQKRALLDILDEQHRFDLPNGMVGIEFDAIWRAVLAEMKRENKTFADEGKTEDEMKAEYRAIAERRVRLGLVLAEIGRLNNIMVSQDELTRAITMRARQFPGQERKVVEFYQQNPGAVAEIRAPIFEDKVVDFILTLAQTEEEKISKADLFTDPDDLIVKRGPAKAAAPKDSKADAKGKKGKGKSKADDE